MNNPIVSVLMTAFNREEFIAEAIESVLKSTYMNFELIIVDDCSKDKTVEIAQSYERLDHRVKVFINEKNLGDYPNRNRAATYAAGEFIYYLDSDDALERNGLEKLVDAMERYPNSHFAMSAPFVSSEVTLFPAKAISNHFFKKPFLVHGPDGTMLRRAFFEKIGRYPVEYGPACDMYFNLKAAARTNILLVPFKFLNYRIHDGQEQNKKFSYLYNNYKYLRDAVNELELPLTKEQLRWIDKKNKRRFTLNVLRYMFKTFDMKGSAKAVKLAKFTLRDAIIGIFHL